jgi:trypsin
LPKIGAFAAAMAVFAVAASPVAAAPSAGQTSVAAGDVLLPGTVGSTAKRSQPRIVGGEVIPITSAPWQAYLEGQNASETYSCGGSILNATTILTAAHCAEPVKNLLPGESLTVFVGTGASNAAPPTRQMRAVTGIKIHPYYDAAGPVATTGDVAVLTLGAPLTLGSPEVQAIALPAPWTPTSTVAPVPQALRVTGFGRIVDGSNVTDYLLRGVATGPSDPDLCGSGTVASANAENAIAICARSSLGSSCQGDSGGPLATTGGTPLLVGVVSNGGRCGPGTDDFYVNLLAPENRQWIDAAVANPGATPPNPPKAPRGLSEPTLTGPQSFRVGDTVSCNAGTFANSPSEIRIEFSKEDGTVLQSTTGPVAQLVLPPAAAGARLVCRPFATNAGGTYVGLKYTTSATVGAAPVSSGGGSPNPGANGATGLPSVCPSQLSQATVFALKIKAPTSARRGQRITVRISRFAPPQGSHGVVVGVEGPKKLLVTGSAGFAATGKASRENDLEEYVKVKIRIPRGVKVGKRYTFQGTMLVANTVDEIGSERVCEYGSKPFKIKIKR